ncbi:hypothetical protein ACWT_3761 [Actinoplanes sp. SE50]|nr:hypothetical protein ACPL_3889 [Actinoplanes sp. SE50/110]ATO83176.1 hypothetical protein ACWT_3761 [Actinoplanes sp. SE50]SLM00583.1 hypothetical protein ACSP50_3816 [Actinoplanes sp. SE50/110]
MISVAIDERDRPTIGQMSTAIAGLLADHGFVFIEDDRVPALGATLLAFLETAQLPINPPNDPGDA